MKKNSIILTALVILFSIFSANSFAQTTVNLPQLCDCPPGDFNITGPACGGSVQSSPANLAWEAVVGASHYELIIDDNSSLNSPNAATFLFSSNSATIPSGGLMANTTYHWTVIAHTASGSAMAANGACQFTTDGTFTSSCATCCLMTGCAALPCTTPSAVIVSPAASTIAAGASQSFAMSGGSPSSSIDWTITPSTGVSPSVGSGAITGAVAFATAGTYTVTFTTTNNSTPATCAPSATTSGSTTVTVNNVGPCIAPTALSCDAAGSATVGGSVTSTVTGGAGGVVTWAISPVTGVSSTSGSGASTGAVTFATAGTYTVTFTSTNSSNPSGCSPSASVTCTRTVTINAVGPCTAPTALSCEAAASTSTGGVVTSTVTGGTGGVVSWAISPTAGVSSTSGSGATTGAITFATAGTYTVTFTSTNSSNPSGCSPSSSVTCTRTITVSATPTLVSSLEGCPTNLTVCLSADCNTFGSQYNTVGGGTADGVLWDVSGNASAFAGEGASWSAGLTAGTYTIEVRWIAFGYSIPTAMNFVLRAGGSCTSPIFFTSSTRTPTCAGSTSTCETWFVETQTVVVPAAGTVTLQGQFGNGGNDFVLIDYVRFYQ